MLISSDLAHSKNVHADYSTTVLSSVYNEISFLMNFCSIVYAPCHQLKWESSFEQKWSLQILLSCPSSQRRGVNNCAIQIIHILSLHPLVQIPTSSQFRVLLSYTFKVYKHMQCQIGQVTIFEVTSVFYVIWSYCLKMKKNNLQVREEK